MSVPPKPLVSRGDTLNDVVLPLIGAVGRHAGRAPGLAQLADELGKRLSGIGDHAADGDSRQEPVVIAPPEGRREEIMARLLESGRRTLLAHPALHVGMTGLPVLDLGG